MSINRQDSRHRIKRSNLTGVEPTIPSTYTPNSDFTDGTWLNTDLREAEFFYNIPDKKLWIGTGETSSVAVEIGLGGLQGLSSVLHYGNNSGTYSIIMGTATVIKSANGGGQIELDYFSSPGEVSITTDNGGQSESYVYLTPTSAELTTPGSSLSLQSNVATLNVGNSARISMRTGTGGFSFDGKYNSSGSQDVIKFIDNFSTTFTTHNSIKPTIVIGSQKSTVNTGVTNSVILGGYEIIATQSNSVYVPDLYIQSGKSIKSTNGSSQIGLDTLGANTIFIDNLGGLGTDAYLLMQNNLSVLGTSETGTTTLIGGSYNFVNAYGSDTGKKSGIDIKTLSGTYSSVRLNNRQFRYDTYSTSAIGTYSIQTLDFMNDGQTISINVMLNSYTSFPDRNIGVKLFAVFIKYGGTIYQTGTTDNVTKDGYSDGTSATIDTDGTNIYIKFHAGSNIFYDVNFAYDYLLS